MPDKAPLLAGVPAKGALTTTGSLLLNTKLGLVKVPEPMMDPPFTTTELTALLAVIKRVPPVLTITLPATVLPLIALLMVLVAPISSTPLLTVVEPV